MNDTEELFPKEPTTVHGTSAAKSAERKQPDSSVLSAAERRKIQLACKEFAPGNPVKHAQFCDGVIAGKQGDIVSIQFSDGKVKRFSLAVALGQNSCSAENNKKQIGETNESSLFWRF